MPALCSKKINKNAITGYGIVTPENVGDSDWKQSEDLNYYRGWKKFRELSEDEKLMLVASRRAFRGANLDPQSVDNTQIGIVFGSTFGTFSNYEAFERRIMEGDLRPSIFSHALANAPASAVSIFWNIEGPCVTVPAQGESQFEIINRAQSFLDNGFCDYILVGGWVNQSDTYTSYYDSKGEGPAAVALVMESGTEFDSRSMNFYTLFERGMVGEPDCIFRSENQRETDSQAEVINLRNKLEFFADEPISLLWSVASSIDWSKSGDMEEFILDFSTGGTEARFGFKNIYTV